MFDTRKLQELFYNTQVTLAALKNFNLLSKNNTKFISIFMQFCMLCNIKFTMMHVELTYVDFLC